MSKLLIENPSVVPVSEVEVSPVVEASGSPPQASQSKRNWLVMTCLLLAISGGIRYWRESKYQSLMQVNKDAPFPLKEISSDLGTWRATGADAHLDPETTRLAGSSDHIIRSYTDSKTGETVSVLVLYGLAYSVFGHSPEICYPSAGFQAVGRPEEHDLYLPDSATSVQYRSAIYSKTIATVTQSYEVVWVFWNAGSWISDLTDRWKIFRTSPGLFKIQIQYPVKGISAEHSPVQSLLKELVEEINTRREKAASASAVNVSMGIQTPRQ